MAPVNGSAERETVDLPALTRALGLTRNQREDLLDSGAIKPVEPRRGRRGTRISPEDAERLEAAVEVMRKAVNAGLIGVGIVLIFRLLASGAVEPPS